jgi:hypothetical protein
LMYVMMMTWLHIAYVVSIAAWYNDQPKQSKWSIIKWILSYLQSTINYGLFYYYCNYIKHNFKLFLWCWLSWKPRWLQILNMVCSFLLMLLSYCVISTIWLYKKIHN